MAHPLPLGPRIGLASMFVLTVLLPIALGALDTGTITCTREGALVRCECVEALFGLERGRLRIDDVTGARLEFTPVKKSRGTYRTVLRTRAGERKLSDAFNWSDEGDAALADRVTHFVGTSEPTMTFSQPGWGWTLVLSVSLFLLVLQLALPRLTARAARIAESDQGRGPT